MGRLGSSGGATIGIMAAAIFAAILGACGSGSGSTFPANGHDGGNSGQDGGGGGSGDSGVVLNGDSGGGSGVMSLYFTPPKATVTLDGTGAATQNFTLHAKYSDGSIADVSPMSVQFDRPDLASLKAGEPVVLTASGPYAGTGTLQAVVGGQTATATLTVQMHISETGTGVPASAVSALGGSGLAADPSLSSLLYPYDQTYFALGLASPLVMWAAPNAGDVYRIHYEEKNYAYDGYFLVPQPGQIRIDQATWDELTASNSGDPLKLTLSRWDAATMKAYTSASESWTIVPASLQGAIYYWTVSGTGHMSRIQPGTGAAPDVLNGGTCMGCHAVSADGSTLVASVEGEGSTDNSDARSWVSYTLPGVTQVDASHLFGGNVAVNPDGKYTVFGTAPMHLGVTATGMEITTSGVESFPLDPGMVTLAHPAFSPDGKYFAAIQSDTSWVSWTVGKLALMTWDESSETFTSPTKLADGSMIAGANHAIAYPSFSPDSNWIAFHVADYATACNPNGCDVNTADTGALYLQNVGGATPVELTTLTNSSPIAADHDLSFEPTFNPIERGGYFWVVFTSERNWGNEVVSATPNAGQKRLWVAAIDSKPGATDPSHPAFFLEGQEETDANMRGFWALAACTPTKGGGACSQGFQCCSGFCDKGMCVDKGMVACAGEGGSCKETSDCCNAGSVTCIGGKCSAEVPK
jgi:Tol biopolymer transport system component